MSMGKESGDKPGLRSTGCQGQVGDGTTDGVQPLLPSSTEVNVGG